MFCTRLDPKRNQEPNWGINRNFAGLTAPRNFAETSFPQPSVAKTSVDEHFEKTAIPKYYSHRSRKHENYLSSGERKGYSLRNDVDRYNVLFCSHDSRSVVASASLSQQIHRKPSILSYFKLVIYHTKAQRFR